MKPEYKLMIVYERSVNMTSFMPALNFQLAIVDVANGTIFKEGPVWTVPIELNSEKETVNSKFNWDEKIEMISKQEFMKLPPTIDKTGDRIVDATNFLTATKDKKSDYVPDPIKNKQSIDEIL